MLTCKHILLPLESSIYILYVLAFFHFLGTIPSPFRSTNRKINCQSTAKYQLSRQKNGMKKLADGALSPSGAAPYRLRLAARVVRVHKIPQTDVVLFLFLLKFSFQCFSDPFLFLFLCCVRKWEKKTKKRVNKHFIIFPFIHLNNCWINGF